VLFEALHEGVLRPILCVEDRLEVHHCICEELKLILVPGTKCDGALKVSELSDALDCLLIGFGISEHTYILIGVVGKGTD
jgi:hypothetical protein